MSKFSIKQFQEELYKCINDLLKIKWQNFNNAYRKFTEYAQNCL